MSNYICQFKFLVVNVCMYSIVLLFIGKGQIRVTFNYEIYFLWVVNDEERQKWIKNIRKVMYFLFGGGRYYMYIK